MKKVQWYVRALDRRFSHHDDFLYRIELSNGASYEKAQEFNEMRHWFTNTFGPSVERELYWNFEKLERNVWAWHTDCKADYFLYLKSNKELALWKLRWT